MDVSGGLALTYILTVKAFNEFEINNTEKEQVVISTYYQLPR